MVATLKVGDRPGFVHMVQSFAIVGHACSPQLLIALYRGERFFEMLSRRF